MTGGEARAGADPLRRAASRRPGATAADGGGEVWSYRRLDRAASAVAGRVREATADRNAGEVPARVAAFLLRRPGGLAALHGVPRAGAVLAPLHAGWTDPELAAYMQRLAPDLVLGPPDALARAGEAAPGVPRLRATTGDPGGSDGGGGGRPEADEIGGEAPAVDPGRDHSLVATSGSTGTPRPVRLTWGNHLASARGAQRRLDLRPADRWYASLSLAHVGGLAMALRAAAVGSGLLLREGFDAAELSRLIEEGRVTHASLVPVMLRRLLEARGGDPPPESFRCALVGGAAAPEALLGRAREHGIPVALTYGLSEACSQVATAPPGLVRRKPGTAGPPLPGVEVRTGGDGEILVRGPTVSPGYLGGEPAAPDGWLRTGDAGRLDDDGHLWVTGRLSERIVTGGTTVHPAEVEEALGGIDGVEEAAVVGVEDEEWGEVVAAAVVAGGGGPGREELEREARRCLSSARRPRRWLLLDELPRVASGKPDRADLRRRFERGEDDRDE